MFRSLIVSSELIRHVTKPLVGSCRGGVELGSYGEVSKGRRQVAVLLIRFTALEVRHHRLRPEGQRAAVGFERHDRLARAGGPVTEGDEALELSITTEAGVHEYCRRTNQQHEQDKDGATHTAQW